jgi:hypothetical protein
LRWHIGFTKFLQSKSSGIRHNFLTCNSLQTMKKSKDIPCV